MTGGWIAFGLLAAFIAGAGAMMIWGHIYMKRNKKKMSNDFREN